MENLHEQVQEVEEYNRFLETVLIQLCEELDIDPQELVEDILTAGRDLEHKKKLKRSEKLMSLMVSAANKRAAEKYHKKNVDQYTKELQSKRTYGAGGKVLTGLGRK